jgi:cobalt-zinc-cadmium efflux system outer membrane protein
MLFLPISRMVRAQSDSLLNLRELVKEAIENNPGLKALMADYKAAEARVSGFRYLMDPMVSIEWDGETRMYGFSQQVPFPTKIATQSKLEALQTEQTYLKYAGRLRSMIREVKTAYADLYFSHRKVETVEREIFLLRQVYSTTVNKYSLGQASQSEVLRVQIELSRAENELSAARDDIAISETALGVLLNRQIDAPMDKPQEPTTEIDELGINELYALAKEQEPRLKVYDLAYKKAELMKSMARQAYLPDFMLGFSQMDDAMHDQKYMLGITLPLWFLGKQNNLVAEAEYGRQMAQADYMAVENDVLLSVKRTKLRMDKQKRLVELYENSILPQTEAAMKSAFTEYQVNMVGFRHLLDTAMLLVQTELEYHRAYTDYFVAVAELEQAIGIVE